MKTYKTAQIAKLIGVHPNTIRFYEDMKLLPKIPRTDRGYRMFNDWHLKQLHLLRTAFRAEIISGKLRYEAIRIVKSSAEGDLKEAHRQAQLYLEHLTEEKSNAEEAIQITYEILKNNPAPDETLELKGRKDVASLLGISTDVLRDWERNGLLSVPRDNKGYRKYGTKEMKRLKIIRTLRNTHYSMMSILRMLRRLDHGGTDLQEAIDTPREDEDIVCATDRYISALCMAQQDALDIFDILETMKQGNVESVTDHRINL